MVDEANTSSFDAYLRRISKKDHDLEQKNTLNWYLRQIREAVKEQTDIRALNVLQKAGEAVKEVKAEVKEQGPKSPAEARDAVTRPNVAEAAGGFSTLMYGRMIFYMYDAKYKETLPYWDVFPLVFPIKSDRQRMLGLNMHYLPPILRARFMTALMTLANTVKLAPQTKLMMTYKLLDNSSKFIYYKPAIKCYLLNRIRSRVSIINPEQWVNVLFMPLADWRNNVEDKVYLDSINKIRGALFKKGSES